jgi:PAS domain S-box-containing protein
MMIDVRYMIDHASDAAFAISGGGEIIAWNHTAQSLLGYTWKEVRGRPCEDILQAVCTNGELLCFPGCDAIQCFLRHQPFAMTACRARHKDGGWLPVSFASVAMPADDGQGDAGSAIAVVFLHANEEKCYRPAPGPTLEINTLGRFALAVEDCDLEINKWKRKQALTLLKILTLHLDRGVHRNVLVEHLWPDADEAHGLERLKATMYFLRKQLRTAGAPENVVERTGKTYALLGDAVWVDALAFEAHVAEGSTLQSQHQWDEALECFKQAQCLYRGDYMEEDIYADWCTEERERLREIYLEALAGIVDCHTEQGRYAEAVQVCRIAIVQEPCRESFHCALIENLVHLGRADWALAQYRACQRILERELGVAPMPKTQHLMRRILAGEKAHHSMAPRKGGRSQSIPQR